MQDLRNLRKLHSAARDRVIFLEQNQKLLKEQNRLLQEMTENSGKIIQALKLRVEELERMIFGKKKRKKEEDTDIDEDEEPREKTKRQSSSFHRFLPKNEDITKEEYHTIGECPDCKTKLDKKSTAVFFVEDIILGQKEIIKHIAEKGWCPKCERWKSAVPTPGSKVIFGEKVKAYISHLSILLRLPYQGIRTLLETTYRLKISDGEIAKVLEKEAKRAIPEYESLKERIRLQNAVHYDETSWKVQKEGHGNYAWVMTGEETDEAVFVCGKSRGKGSFLELSGKSEAVGITDDYGVYKNAFKTHALCWAHPERKFRDLAESGTLQKEYLSLCEKTHRSFSLLYHDVRKIVSEPFDGKKRMKACDRFRLQFDEVARENTLDPKKLATLKASLRKNKEAYFVCVLHGGVPCDNNKAERSLRHLVLKRNSSFGSKTQKGANVTAVLASVILSIFWKGGDDFFGEWFRLGRV